MDAKYYFDTGMSFIEKGELRKALTCFEESAKLQPDFADANFGAGVCKVKLGDKANGEAAIRKAARLGCKEAQSYFDLCHDTAINTTFDSNGTFSNKYDDRKNIDLSVDRRNNNKSISPSQPLEIAIDHLGFSLAARWPRFFARILDIWWEVLFVAFALIKIGRYSGFVMPSKDPEGANMLFGLICLPLALIMDASVYRLFENTPGKAWLGLKTSTIDGRALSFGQYLARNFSVWVKGLAFGIPLFNLFTLHDQYSRLGKGKQASYDEQSEYTVCAQPIGLIRKVSFGLAFAFLFFILAILNGRQQPNKPSSVPINVSQNYSWKNPLTGISTNINSHWKISVQNNADKEYIYIFSDQDGHAITILGVEYSSSFTLSDYIEALKIKTSSNFQLSGNGHFFSKDGHQSWQCTGTIPDGTNNVLKVQVIQIGSAFWRIATIQMVPYDSSDRSVDQLQAAIWSTVK